MTITLTDFQDQGACRDHDPELFFPVSETRAYAPQIKKAKAVCTSCPVQTACRTWALATAVDGVWGGMTEDERRKARAKKLKRERELAAAQASDEPGTEQLVDEPASRAAAAMTPEYQLARQQLSRARRALTRARAAGNTAATTNAQQRVTAAEQRLADARVQDVAGVVA